MQHGLIARDKRLKIYAFEFANQYKYGNCPYESDYAATVLYHPSNEKDGKHWHFKTLRLFGKYKEEYNKLKLNAIEKQYKIQANELNVYMVSKQQPKDWWVSRSLKDVKDKTTHLGKRKLFDRGEYWRDVKSCTS